MRHGNQRKNMGSCLKEIGILTHFYLQVIGQNRPRSLLFVLNAILPKVKNSQRLECHHFLRH